MSDLYSGVEQLTRVHKKTIHTIDGFEVHDRDPLLTQLRDAVFGGMEKTGGSGSKARLPISEAASDLYTLIDGQIAEAWSAWTGRVPSPLATPENLLAEWSAGVSPEAVIVVTRPEQNDQWDAVKKRMAPRVIRIREEHTPETLADQWVKQIDDFLNPEKTAGIQAPCIQCGESKVSRRRDGESYLTDALVFRRDRETDRTLDARCLSCGTTWPPSQFEYLAEALGIQKAKAEVHE